MNRSFKAYKTKFAKSKTINYEYSTNLSQWEDENNVNFERSISNEIGDTKNLNYQKSKSMLTNKNFLIYKKSMTLNAIPEENKYNSNFKTLETIHTKEIDNDP